jgi:tetratricopeptide (TPR) repeat protein
MAGQELWIKEKKRPLNIEAKKDKRPLPIKAFDLLKDIHEDFDFGKEWQKIKKKALLKTVLKYVPNLGECKSIIELTIFLKKCRELYEHAVKHKENHRFLDARDAIIELESLLPGYSEKPQWMKSLQNEEEICKLQAINDTAETEFVYDDRLPWETKYPYRLFRQLGACITPGSSMEEVQEELQKLTRQEGEVTEETRSILETLVKNTNNRLFVDAFFYPLCPSKDTLHSINESFLKSGRLPTPRDITADFTDDAALLLLMLGQPEAAEAIWKKALCEDPLEGLLAHCLGLLYLGQAYEIIHTDLEKGLEYWRAAIAHWTVVLENDAYWVQWGRQRYSNYKTPFVNTSIDTLIGNIRSYLRRLLDINNGEERMTAHIEQLGLDLNIESEAVHLSDEIGGIDLGQGCFASFGPLWMAAYNLQDVVANHIASFRPSHGMGRTLPGKLPPEEVLRRLRRYFSYLSVPAILLEGPGPNPGEALKILYQNRQPQTGNCSDSNCPVHGENKFPVLVYCTSEENFKVDNPAYKGLENPTAAMCEDALQLAIAAHSQLAGIQIRHKELKKPEILQSQWQQILKLAKHSRNHVSAREGLRSLALGETRPFPTGMADLDAAIKIVEICINTLSGSYGELKEEVKKEESLKDHALKKRLAELFACRGTKKSEQDDLPGAEADLKRALDIAPYIHQVRINLATEWYNQSVSVSYHDRFLAQDYLRRADELIKTGEKEFEGWDYSEIKAKIALPKEKLALSKTDAAAGGGDTEPAGSQTGSEEPPPRRDTSDIAWLYSQGIRELRENRPDAALNIFEQTLETAHDDIDILEAIPRALMEYAMRLSDDKHHDDALKLVNHWLHRLPAQEERIQNQLEFLKGWPYLRTCLEEPKDFDDQLSDYQGVRLFFLDQNEEVGLSWVHVRVEGNYISLSALMPLFPDSEKKTGMLNLLQVSNDIMPKLAYSDKSQLVLKCLVPFRLLEPEWFSQTALDLFKFSDISVKQVLNIETLRAQFREIEASSVQRHHNHHLTESTRALKNICRERNLRCDRLTDVHYKVDGGRFEMKTQTNGTRLFTSLGKLRSTTDPLPIFIKIAKQNAILEQCKLALDEHMNVILDIPLPHMDKPAVSEAFNLLEKHSADLARKLTNRNQAIT